MKRMIVALLLSLAIFTGVLSSASISVAAAVPVADTGEILSLLEQGGNMSHPRLLADGEDFDRVRRLVQTDPYMMHWYERLYAYTEEQLEQPVPTYEYPAGSRQLDAISRITTARVCNMALVYHVTGDKRFASRAVQELIAVSNFPDWRAKEYLDMTQLAYGVAIGYDWLYDYMTEGQRLRVRDALYNYAVLPTVTTHRNDWYKTSVGNLNTWCNGMVTIAALAVLEDYPQDAALLISDAVTNVQVAMNKLLPMGSYIEAPSYFGPGICYLVQMIDCIESTLGTDFGLSEVEGLRETADYLTKMNGERCSFNYGDCPAAVIVTPSLYWFANRYSRPELAVYERSHQQISISTPDDYLALLWYDPEAVEGMDEYEGHTDALLYSDAYESTATFRSFPEDPRRIFAGIKSGDNTSPHSDLDIGTFVLEALGELWFMDFGSDSYGLPGYFTQAKETDPRWTYYRKRTEGQNTLLMNPGTLGGQVLAAKCQLDAYESAYDGGYATLDMTAAYPDASSVKRGMAMFDNRSRILLVDEIQCKNPTDLYWFAHTKAAVSLSADGKTAELTLKGKTLLAQILSPSNATFSLMEAKPLSTSPNPSGQNANAGVQKLTIHLNSFQNGNIAVVFTPVLEESDRSRALPGNSIAAFPALLQHCAPGTALAPNQEGIYEIRTAEELMAFSQMVNSGTTFSGKTVRLLNDIDLKHRTFTPIGGCTGAESDQGKSFRGIFDGGNHSIKNLLIYEPNSFYVGLFGYVNNGTVKNVGIENGYVFGNRKVAGLVGRANHTVIAGCFSKAKVICAGGQAGGLVSCVGGECSITDSYHNGIVRSKKEIAGGIVGFIPNNVKVTIQNCYHTGELSDTQGSCGLIGYYGMLADAATTQITVDNCYATDFLRGSTTGDKEYVAISQSAVVGKEELPSFAINLGSAYMYDCEWENDGYPVLNGQCNLTLPENLHLDTAEELRLLAFLVNSGKDSFQGKTVSLDRDIDLQYRQWLPIGGNLTDLNGSKVFRGTFDGQGHVIRNLKISPKRYFVGFFGNMSGELRNFGIESGQVNALRIGGSLAGNFSGTMENCFSRAFVSCDIAAGGLIGMAGKTEIANCYHVGKVSAASYSYGGGIVGYFAGGAGGSVVRNCYHAGTVTGKNTGGIAGIASSSLTDLTISNCYATDSQTLVDSSLASYVSGGGCVDSATLMTGDTLLGQAYTSDPAKGRNSGYPILTACLYGRAQDATLPQNDQGEYLISTADQLRHLAYRVNVLQETFEGKTIRLCSDINLEYQEWIPIGGSAPDNVYRTFFKGTFEGDGYRIRNLVISSGNCFVGLFGQLQGAVVRNVGVESGYISGNRSVAAIAGASIASTVDGCYNRAKVFGTSGVGGIVGMAGSNNKISNCYNMGRISGPDSSGGILGYIAGNTTKASVIACYNGAPAPAGLVGIVSETAKNCTLTDSLAVAGPELVNTPASLTLDRCFTDTPSGISYSLPIFSDSFTQDYFMQNNGYPVLKWENKDHRTEFDSVDGIYLIHDTFDLGLLSYKVRQNTDFTGKTFLMTRDLDLEYRPFFPIGGQYEGESFAFRGTFDGGGHRICGLLSHSRTVDNEFTALFGRTENATIRNLGITDSRINNGVNTAGGIVAYATSTKIENSFNRGSVRNLGNYVGGIIGRVVGNCALENVYCTGSVAGGPASHGGLIGFMGTDVTSLVLKNCYVHCRLITTDIAGCGAYMGYLQGGVSTSKIKIESCCYGGKADATSDRLTAKQRQHISPPYYTTEEMKAAYAYLGAAYVKDSAMTNRGFPILQWEQAQNCRHTNVAVENLLKIRRILCLDCGSIREEYQIYTGSCGADLVWTLYAETGLFTVKGTGDMTEYVYNNHAPWEVYASLITELQISEGCTSIGSFTFYGCRELTDVSIPNTVTRIGTSAFYDCRALETVVLPEHLTLIGDSAFSNCQNLRSINIPHGVTRIGTFGFYNCYKLSDIVIPSSMQSIGHSAFYNCDGLSEVILPEGIASIDESTFHDCDTLTRINIPETVKVISSRAFFYCGSLTSIALPYGLETICDHAFYYTALTGISIPQSVNQIQKDAFGYCSDLAYIAIFNPDCEIFGDKNTLGVSTKTVIYGWKGSTAQTYAETYGYMFKELHQDLYFGFGNTREDQTRYDSYTYGFTNFDLASAKPWHFIGADRADALYENGSLVLTGKLLGESSWPAICMDTAIGGASETSPDTAKAYPLNYDPRYAEMIQIRYRMENFVKGEYLNKDTGEIVSVPPYLTVAFSDAEGLKASVTDRVQIATYINHDDFVVVTIPVPEKMRAMDIVSRLRLYFGGVESASKEALGTLTVDYIYVGREEALPTAVHAVRFMNHDGTVLQNTLYVPTGGTAVYYSAGVPTRKADDVGHYTFQDWTKPLENVQQNTDFVARYKAEAHTFRYTNVNSGSHKATCFCGYTKTLSHSWDSGQVTIEPTCTVPGVRTYICTGCKTKITESIAARGHTSVTDPAVEPTCTESGLTIGTHCSVCSAIINAQEVIPAKGHTEVVDMAVAATCTTAGKTEGKHCSVCNTVLVAQQTVPATGHSYIYTKVNALIHVVTCKNCDYSAEVTHSYENGFCICGEPEIKEPIQNSNWKLGHSLNLASDISVNLAISKSNLTGFDMDTVYVESIIDIYEGNEKIGATTIRIEPVESEYYYYFTLNGLTAVQMNDTITSTLYGTKGGQPYCSPVDVYSIATYAYSQLGKTTVADNLKTLCADLLRYGAKAQIFKNYRTDSLADANMTDAHKAYLSDIDSVTFGNTNKVLNDLENAPISWTGKALDLESKVALKFVFNPANYQGDLSTLTLKVSYTDINGSPKSLSIKDPELYNPDRGLYVFTLDALLAAELRTVVSVQIFAGDIPVSCTLQYSADTYGNNKTGKLLELCKALFAYSDSAKLYFTAQ